jgi:RimJ/RimL family protein N-acetyltransferase
MVRTNTFGQPIGDALPHWRGAERPPRTPMRGRFVRIEPLDAARHLDELYDAFSPDPDGKLWTYIPIGPFGSKTELGEWLEPASKKEDPLFYVMIDASAGKVTGLAAYLRIQPEHGVIEIGNIVLSPLLQRTAAATEAMFLFMARAFDELGYRRYEWKCDSLNAPSRRAAERLGFQYDGLFRQAIVYKGRNRDTAWYSILDKDWPALRRAFTAWLDEDNFDESGQQKARLQDFIAASREAQV